MGAAHGGFTEEVTFAQDLHGGWLAVSLRALQDHTLPVFPPWALVALEACLGAIAGPHNDRSVQCGSEVEGPWSVSGFWLRCEEDDFAMMGVLPRRAEQWVEGMW